MVRKKKLKKAMSGTDYYKKEFPKSITLFLAEETHHKLRVRAAMKRLSAQKYLRDLVEKDLKD